MADDKKKPEGRNIQTELIYLLAGLFLLSIIITRLEDALRGGGLSLIGIVWLKITSFFFAYIAPILKLISALVSAAAVYGIFKVMSHFNVLLAEEKELYGSKIIHGDYEESPQEKNGRWERIIELINSANSSDWRLAIIEADVMLEDLLNSMGYHGESIGEMLKAVEVSDFLTLDAAWEAHKVRNKIAHSGSEFALNEREAKRVIALFESVFREFKII
jgi:hypothetical protein